LENAGEKKKLSKLVKKDRRAYRCHAVAQNVY
jgi:hypothetical protein